MGSRRTPLRSPLVPLLLTASVSATFLPASVTAQQRGTVDVIARSAADIRAWDAVVSTGTRDGRLKLRASSIDPALPSHSVERFEQFIGEVPVLGAEIVRDLASGQTEAIFGRLEEGCDVSTTPGLDVAGGNAALVRAAGDGAILLKRGELVIVRDGTGRCVLAYGGVTARPGDVKRMFVDARTGAIVLAYSGMERQSAVGTGTGVLNDTKKVSTANEAGLYYTDDKLRPPVLVTYDMRGNPARVENVLDGAILFASERGSDADNVWTDAAVVDAHVHMGWTYDFYFKRYARRGYNDADRAIAVLANPVRQQDAVALFSTYDYLIANAFWCNECGRGLVVFGSGFPSSVAPGGRTYANFAGAFDIVAHEYTHAVTSSTSRLIYRNEAGALNEAFSDVMATAAEFFHQPAGDGPGRADYLIGEDIARSVRAGVPSGLRSMADPRSFGDPDHYSQRYLGPDDDGGVHTNSSIMNHAYYLAVEGGTNRTSGMAVRGVGAANRTQIEDAFYRAFTQLMPSSGTYSMARSTTLQAARSLFGANSNAERALTEAWDAVGVQ